MFIKGRVIKGHSIGKQLGFPTLNISYKGKIRGVFAGKILIDGTEYKAAVNVGPRPTFGDDGIFCEACLIDWNGDPDLEGKEIRVELFDKIRDIQKFDTMVDLSRQIAKDMEFVKICATG